MKKTRDFINKNRVYILMLVFITIFNIANLTLPSVREYNQQKGQMLEAQESKTKEKLKLQEEALLKNISENQQLQRLAGILTFLFCFVVLVGLGLLITFVRLRLKQTVLFPKALSLPEPAWEIWDAVRISIIFVFFNYILFLTETLLESFFGVQVKDSSIRMILNTITMDFLALGFIFYFLFVKFSQRLNAIGLSIKDFLQNFFLGLLGYLTFLPVLIAVIVISYVLGNYFNIEPKSQPFFDLFIEEKRIAVLAVLTVFVVIIGPVLEEIFFRGFLYSALKKRFNVSFAIFLASFVFAFLHMNTLGFLPIFVLAFILAYMFEKTGSLVPSIIIHCVHNGMIVVFLFLTRFFAGNF